MIAKPTILAVVIGLLSMTLLSACGGNQPESSVYFMEPRDGAEVKSPFIVQMGSENLVIEPAQADVDYLPGHGHHHIIIDADLPRLDMPIPANSVQHLHFGKAQIETTLDLEPGEHSLRLLFAKGDHISWSPAQTANINVTVVK